MNSTYEHEQFSLYLSADIFLLKLANSLGHDNWTISTYFSNKKLLKTNCTICNKLLYEEDFNIIDLNNGLPAENFTILMQHAIYHYEKLKAFI